MESQLTWLNLAPGNSTGAQAISVLGEPDRRQLNAGFAQVDNLVELGWYSLTVTAYVRGNDQLFLVIVAGLSTKPDLPPSLATWIGRFGKPQAILSSSIDKHAKEYVYPRQGLALVSIADAIRQVRLFPPCSMESYRESLYIAPSHIYK